MISHEIEKIINVLRTRRTGSGSLVLSSQDTESFLFFLLTTQQGIEMLEEKVLKIAQKNQITEPVLGGNVVAFKPLEKTNHTDLIA